jgi:hypothetical protein
VLAFNGPGFDVVAGAGGDWGGRRGRSVGCHFIYPLERRLLLAHRAAPPDLGLHGDR